MGAVNDIEILEDAILVTIRLYGASGAFVVVPFAVTAVDTPYSFDAVSEKLYTVPNFNPNIVYGDPPVNCIDNTVPLPLGVATTV